MTEIQFDDFSRQYYFGLHCSRRVVKEARIAIKSWALFNAMNGNDEHPRNELKGSLKHLQLSDHMIYMRLVMVFDTLMAVFRLTDPVKKDSLTFLNLVKSIENDDFLDQVIHFNNKKFVKLGCSFETQYENQCRVYAKEFLELFSSKWKNSDDLVNKCIFTFREKYKPLRDSILAHSGRHGNITVPIIDEINLVVDLLVQQACQVHYIYSGNMEPLKEFSEKRNQESLELWNFLEQGLSQVSGSK